jgi:hypothetical protein
MLTRLRTAITRFVIFAATEKMAVMRSPCFAVSGGSFRPCKTFTDA